MIQPTSAAIATVTIRSLMGMLLNIEWHSVLDGISKVFHLLHELFHGAVVGNSQVSGESLILAWVN